MQKLRLTYPQQNILLVEKVNKDLPINSIVGTIEIDSRFDEKICSDAINNVIKNNDAMRINIVSVGDQTYQTVKKYEYKNIEVIDLSLYSESQVKEYINDCVLLPLILDKNELFEFKIFDYGNGKGAIFMKSHHIISDAWSCSKIGNQLIEYIEAKLNGEEVVDEIKPSYIEFAEKEMEYESSEKFEKDEEFWNEYLSDVKEAVSLKSIHNLPSRLAERYTVDVSSSLNEQIKEFCKENKISVYSLFLTSLSIYLKRINNRNDIVVGTPVLNRANFKEKQMLGMFISTIPLRIKMENENTFLDLAKSIGSNTMTIFRHQKYPYAKMLENVRKTSSNKENLYKIAFSYQNARVDLDSDRYTITWKFNKHIEEDLDIHIEDLNNTGELKIHYDYLVDIFNEIEIEYLHNRLITIIQNGILNKDVLVKNIEIVSEDEKDKILVEFNNTEVEFPDYKTYIELFEDSVKNTPENIAFVFGEEKITYKELNEKINSLAYYLRNEKNVKRNDKVSLLLKRNLNMIISILAVIKAGGAYVPIDPEFPEDRINYMIENSDSVLVIKSKEIEFENDISIVVDDFNFSKYPSDNLEIINEPTDLIYIIYTSGTTGKPKGVMINHSNVINLCFAANNFQKLDECKIWGGFSSYSFDISIFETLVPLSLGKTTILANEDEQKIAEKMQKLIVDNNIEVVYMTPTRMQLLINYDINGEAIYKFKRVLLGGEEFPKNYYEKLKNFTDAKIYDGYGPTEITVWSSAKEIEDKENINIGYSIPNVFSYILDEENNILPIGCKGELCVGGKGVAVGYYKNEEATNSKFIEFNDDRIYKTGDIAYFNFNGELVYVGRKDSQIKLHGLRIEIEEIESAIKSFDGIIQAAVIVRDDKLFAYFSSDSKIFIDDLKNYLKSKLPRYMIPVYYMQVEKFDFTILGKIDKTKLPEIGIKTLPYVEPRNITELKISKAISNLLKVDKVGIDDNLFELGLDSLNALTLVTKLSREGIRLTYGNIYDYQTIRELNDFLENNKIKELYTSIKNYDYTKIDKTLSINKIENIEVPLKKNEIGNIMLVGATGFLGSHILGEFLENETGKAYCFVRKKDGEAACDRLDSRLKFYFGDKYTSEIGNRIIVIETDISKKNFGVSEAIINELKKEVRTAINTAAIVSHFGEEEKFKTVNVESSNNIGEFCLKFNKRLIYISTLSVSGNVLEGGYIEQADITEDIIYDESKLYVNQKLNNIYIYTKFLAERHLLELKAKGLDLKIMRFGNLTSRISDNKFQINDKENAFANRLRTLLKIRMLPNNLSDFYLEFTPVDFAAHTIINLAKIDSKYTMFHLFNHNHVYLKKFVELMKKIDIDIKFLEENEFARKIDEYMKDDRKANDLSGIIIDLNKDNGLKYITNTTIKSDYTIKILELLGITWPEISDDYIIKYITSLK